MALLIVVALCFLGNLSADEVKPQRVISTPQRLCGSDLSNMLYLVCDGIYNKRSMNSDTEEFEDGLNWIPEEFGEVGSERFTGRARALTLLKRFRGSRRSGGVADECCSKSCSIQEMLSYCGNKN